jgi:hypothetical protein
MSKPTVYIETTVVSYLTAHDSKDPVMAGHQKSTRDWWDNRRELFEPFGSYLVDLEAGAGDSSAAAARLEVLSRLPKLGYSDEAARLAEALVAAGAVPATADRDASHIAIAATTDMAYLLTWNFAHINNPATRDRISQSCRDAGYEPPIICTPEELLEVTP